MKKLLSLIVILSTLFLFGCKKLKTEVTYVLNPGQDTILVGQTWQDAGMVIKYGTIDLVVNVDSSDLNINQIGTYEIVYEAVYKFVDYTYVRYVQVIDATAPTIQLNPGVDTIFVGDTWIDSGVVVSDNYDTSITYSTEGQVNKEIAGQYIITYRATDASGNVAKRIRIVTVIE